MKQALLVACGFAIVALLAVIAYQNYQRFHRPLITTAHQAVMLTNGAMFYGRIDHLGSNHPVLRDVVSVRAELEPQTQAPRYVVVRRKDEPNGADHMIIPATSIVFVEPVRADSIIGRLIQQAGALR